MPSLAGHFLIASTQLVDPNFARAVVLILQHDENGAMGVIINRPLGITVKDACAQSAEIECGIERMLHAGGPCEGPLIALHTEADYGERAVMEGLWFTIERPKLERLFEADTQPIKYVANYAGWGLGQLEAEMGEGSWLLLPATVDQTFADEASLWDKLITQATLGRWIDPKRIPDDPSMN